MRNRFGKGFLIAGGIIVLLLGAVGLAATRLFPGDMVTDRIVRELTRATGAKVTLGEARLGWRRGWRITLRTGMIQGTGAALAAATGSPSDLESYTVEIDELVVCPSLWPMVHKELVVESARLTGTRLDIRWPRGEVRAVDFVVRIMDLNLDLAGSPGDLLSADLALAFAAEADTLVLQGAPYTGFEMSGGYADRKLVAEELSAHRSSGNLRGTFTLDFAARPRGHLVFEAVAESVPAADMLAPWSPEVGDRLECGLNAAVKGGFDLGKDGVIRETVAVIGLLTAGQGILRASDWLRDISPYLGSRQDLKDIRFGELSLDFRMEQGRYLVRELLIRGGDTDWRGTGWVDPIGAIAMEIDVKLPPGFTPDLGNWSFLAGSLRDAEGRINLPLKLSGRTARPTVGVDLGRLKLGR